LLQNYFLKDYDHLSIQWVQLMIMIENHPWYNDLKLPTNELHYINQSLQNFQKQYQQVSKSVYGFNTKSEIAKNLDELYSHSNLAIYFKEVILKYHGAQIYVEPKITEQDVVSNQDKSYRLQQFSFINSFINDLINQIRSDIEYLEVSQM